MPEERPGQEIEGRLSKDADELDERLDELGDHIDDARRKHEERRDEASAGEEAFGDVPDDREDSEGVPGAKGDVGPP